MGCASIDTETGAAVGNPRKALKTPNTHTHAQGLSLPMQRPMSSLNTAQWTRDELTTDVAGQKRRESIDQLPLLFVIIVSFFFFLHVWPRPVYCRSLSLSIVNTTFAFA